MGISLWKSIQFILATHLIGVFFFTTYFITTFMQNFIQDSNDFTAKTQQITFFKKSQLDYYIFTQEIKKYDSFESILVKVLEGNLIYQTVNDQDLTKNYDIIYYEHRSDSECLDWVSKHIFLIDYFYKGMKPISNHYIIYNDTCALALTSNYPIFFGEFSSILRESARKAHIKGRYLSKTITSEGSNVNLLCKDWDFAVICSEIYTKYIVSMFVIDGFEVLWHSNLQDDLTVCEFGNEDYPLVTIEKTVFRENIIENKEKVRVEAWFIKKGEKMYEICRNVYMDKYDRWNFGFTDNYSQFSMSSLEKTLPILLAELIIISIILVVYIYHKILHYSELYLNNLKQSFSDIIEYGQAVNLGDFDRIFGQAQTNSDISSAIQTFENLRVLSKFLNPHKDDYAVLLFTYSQQYLFFKSINNPEATSFILFQIAEIQFYTSKPEEAMKNIIKSLKILKNYRKSKDEYKVFMLLIGIYLDYLHKPSPWAHYLRILASVREKTQKLWLVSAVIHIKIGNIQAAINDFSCYSNTEFKELGKFVEGLIEFSQNRYKAAAKCFTKALTMEKYYDSAVRDMCVWELSNIISEDEVKTAMKTKEFSKDVAIFIENSEDLGFFGLETCINGVLSIMDLLEPADRLSFAWFCEETQILCKNLELGLYKSSIKNCILSQISLKKKPQMSKALYRALKIFKTCNSSENSPVYDNKKKLVIMIASGQDFSNNIYLSRIYRLIEEGRINLILIGVFCTEEDKLKLEKFLSLLSNTKFLYCKGLRELKQCFSKIHKLFE